MSDYHSVDGGDLLIGRPYGYTEEYQSYEQTGNNKQVAKAYEPASGTISTPNNGCTYNRCPKGYAWHISNFSCTLGHKGTGTWGCIPANKLCPHGYVYASSPDNNAAHCSNDMNASQDNYIAPCGRPTVVTNTPIYGYVTRTRTITYDKQSGLFSIGIGVPYLARNMGIFSTQVMRIIFTVGDATSTCVVS